MKQEKTATQWLVSAKQCVIIGPFYIYKNSDISEKTMIMKS